MNQYFLFPGHNELQLGNSIQVMTKQTTNEEFYLSKQYAWLNQHAHEYGYIIRYPLGKEEQTGMKAQPYTLRYVGVDLAGYLHQSNEVLEEMRVKK